MYREPPCLGRPRPAQFFLVVSLRPTDLDLGSFAGEPLPSCDLAGCCSTRSSLLFGFRAYRPSDVLLYFELTV